MKSILYVGATLMIGASIYGFIDYKKTNHRKEFKGMYETSKTGEITEPSPTKKKVELDESATDKISVEPVTEGDYSVPAVKKTTLKEPTPKTKSKNVKKRKLNYKSFSRAPLKEEVPPAKVKTLSNEQ